MLYEIKQCIEKQLDMGNKKFIIFPFGEIGMQINNILKDAYGIEADFILDNHFCKYNSKIKQLTFLNEINCNEYILILACTNPNIYVDLKKDILQYFKEDNIAELSSMKLINSNAGKYSYGSLCNHWLIESVGSFCSFASGCDIVPNHPTQYISTHPFLYWDKKVNSTLRKTYDENNNMRWYFEGVSPKGVVKKLKKTTIGHDVWFGKNVIITNGANIGNGVIAGAGSIITKDVPDYAIVAGVPARVIRYRYTSEQIKALNKIQWWNWSDEAIREKYNDFFLPIEEFIEKHKV